MSPFDELTEKARMALDGIPADPKGRKTAHVFADLVGGRRVSCSATAQPAGFGTVRTSFSYRVDGKIAAREVAQVALNGKASPHQETMDNLSGSVHREFGSDAAEAFRKAFEKLGPLQDAGIIFNQACEAFHIHGTREGRRIEVNLQQVFKTSSRGKAFTQWPARIYINGEYTPEHIYKKLFA